MLPPWNVWACAYFIPLLAMFGLHIALLVLVYRLDRALMHTVSDYALELCGTAVRGLPVAASINSGVTANGLLLAMKIVSTAVILLPVPALAEVAVAWHSWRKGKEAAPAVLASELTDRARFFSKFVAVFMLVSSGITCGLMAWTPIGMKPLVRVSSDALGTSAAVSAANPLLSVNVSFGACFPGAPESHAWLPLQVCGPLWFMCQTLWRRSPASDATPSALLRDRRLL